MVTIYHDDGELYAFNEYDILYNFYEEKDDPTEFMMNILQRHKDDLNPVFVLTNIFCDYATGPCGCYAYDVCGWHRNRYYDDNPDFAPCLCSEKYKITCEYHK